MHGIKVGRGCGALAVALVVGCGDAGGSGATDGATGSDASTGSGGLTEPGTDAGTGDSATAGVTEGSNSASATTGGPPTTGEVTVTASTGDASTTDPISGTDPGTGGPGSSTGDDSTGDDSTGDSTGDDTTGGPPPPDCEGMMGPEGASLIWIANSGQGTVSKIDTVTLQELGRYRTRPDGGGSPSRTSVSIGGDVVVANRTGGVTKIYADKNACPDTNGVPGLQTSAGANDVLAWGAEECVAWHRPIALPDNRPIAWTKGEQNPNTCAWEGAKVWTAASGQVADTTRVFLLNGATGEIEGEKLLTDVDPNTIYNFGGYGGAVDADDNFWFSQLELGKLVRVDIDDLSHKVWDMPVAGYGMTIGASGYVWTCGERVARFDPLTETWQTVYTGGGLHTGGCMEDGKGRLYKGSHFVIHAIDVETMAIVDVINTLNPPQHFWGIALDFNGKLWAVPRSGTTAYRIDPVTHAADIVQGLVGAYTYSDMTGYALSSVVPQ